MTPKKTKAFYRDKDGMIVFNMASNELDDDWLRSARIAKKNTPEAEKELDEREKRSTYVDGDEDY